MKFRKPVKWKKVYLRVNNLSKEQLLFRVRYSKRKIFQHRKYRRIVERNWFSMCV